MPFHLNKYICNVDERKKREDEKKKTQTEDKKYSLKEQ